MLKLRNTMNIGRALCAMGLTLSFACTAFAQEESTERRHPRPNQFLKDADQNGDRQLSFEEASAAMPRMTAERFERMDQNGDGQLTPNEIHRGRAGGERDGDRRGERGRRFEHVDTNGDGQVSYEELTAAHPNMPMEGFNRIDEDGNGFLSREELRRDGRRDADSRRGDPVRHFEEADINGDGELSFDEFSAIAQRMRRHIFDRMDANGDGAVSREEMAEHRPPHDRRQQRGSRHDRVPEGRP